MRVIESKLIDMRDWMLQHGNSRDQFLSHWSFYREQVTRITHNYLTKSQIFQLKEFLIDYFCELYKKCVVENQQLDKHDFDIINDKIFNYLESRRK